MVGGAIYKILKLNGYGSPKKGGKILKDNVEIIDGGSRMLGDRAEMDLKTGNSRMLSTGSGGRVSGVLQSN